MCVYMCVCVCLCVCTRAVMPPRKTILAACLAQVLIGSQPRSRGSVVPFVCLVVNPFQFVFNQTKITMKTPKARNKTCVMFPDFQSSLWAHPRLLPTLYHRAAEEAGRGSLTWSAPGRPRSPRSPSSPAAWSCGSR